MGGMRWKSALFAAVVLAGIVLAGAAYYRATPRTSPAPLRPNERLLALMARAAVALAIGARSRSEGCVAKGTLPDPACTPGATFPNATARDLCVAGYTQTVRNVPVGLKRRVYEEYGLAYPQERGAYEADHLIPLELGGSNDIANLFPQPAVPAPGYHEKDLVENYLHDEVCAGAIDLAAAQKQIANDWRAVYDALTPDELAALRKEAAQWAGRE